MSRQRARAVARRRAKIKDRDQDRATRRTRLERILGLMGIGGWGRHLDAGTLDHLCREFNPKPRVVTDAGHSRDRNLEGRAKTLQQELDRVAIRIGPDDLSFNDYHSVVMSLLLLFRTGAADRTLGEFMREPAAATEEFARQHNDAIWKAYRSKVLSRLGEAGSIDTAIYSGRREFVPVGNRIGLTLILRRTPVPSRTIVADGVGRRAYLCGDFSDLESGDVDWVEWDARALGLGGSQRLPVYIQSHALHQIRHRLAIKPDHLVDYTLWQSLDEPVLTPLSGNAYLVEYRILQHKLGYLVAEVLGDVVLVRTFLLVTMQGTPEGSEFSRRLRLRRPDIEYLELDHLGTLIATDLARDPEIAGLLRECGCGGALDFAPNIQVTAILEGYAARFRGHMGLALSDISSRYLVEPGG